MKSLFGAYDYGEALVSDLMVYVGDCGSSGGLSGTSSLYRLQSLPMIWYYISSAPMLGNHCFEVFRHPHIQASRGWIVEVSLSVSTLSSVRL